MSYAADPIKRNAILDAEQRRLDWLRDHPAIPVLEWGEEMLYPAADLGEVTAVAAHYGTWKGGAAEASLLAFPRPKAQAAQQQAAV